jgi:hypothetical protein
MRSHTSPSHLHRWFRGLLALVGVAGVLGASTPAEARVASARQALEARVLVMRAAIHDAAEADPRAAPDRTLAQWFNWGNWNNWNNWPNWGNWGNWFNR